MLRAEYISSSVTIEQVAICLPRSAAAHRSRISGCDARAHAEVSAISTRPPNGGSSPRLPTPGKLIDALCHVDIEPRVKRSRVLDQALDSLSVMLALCEHCLGTADRKVVHERRGWLLGLNKGRHAVERLC